MRGVRAAALALALAATPAAAHAAGEVLWSTARDQDLGADDTNAVAVKGKRVLVAGRSDDRLGAEQRQATLHAFDAKTGAELWGHQLEHVQTSEAIALAISGSRAFVALEAENADTTGSGPDWMVTAHEVKSGLTLWEDIVPNGGEERVAALAAKGSRVFAGGEVENRVDPQSGRDWHLRAVSAKSRALLWEDTVDSALLTDRVTAIAVNGKRVVAVGVSNGAVAEGSGGDWMIRALDGKKGTLLWSDVHDGALAGDTPRDVGSTARTTVVVGRSTDAVDVGSEGDWLIRAYDTKTGALLWDDVADFAGGADQARRVAVGKKQVIVVGEATNAVAADSGDDAVVRGYDTKTGALLWENIVDGGNGSTDRAEHVLFAGNAVLVAGRGQNQVAADSGNDWIVRAFDPRSGALLWEDVYDGALGNDRPTASGTGDGIAVKGKSAFVVGRSANAADVESGRDALVRAYDLK